jgi:tetratricopeptide (TPR) repeat protein
MKQVFILIVFCISSIIAQAQASAEESARIRQQMAKIRQTTNWDDPAAAKKANEEIQKLAIQLSGGKPVIGFDRNTASKRTESTDIHVNEVNKEAIVAIADRFFTRSYKALDAVSRNQFDLDFKKAEKLNFSAKAVRELGGTGAALITFGNDHNFACVYIAAAVKVFPTDTLAVNNFGGYLRIIDSIETSLPVLLFANGLFSESPVILTQLGCNYLELNDEVKGEKYLKEALKYNPGFGQAHSALCDLYLKQGRIEDAFIELLSGVKGMGCSYMQASQNLAYMNEQAENNQDLKQKMWDETKGEMDPSEALASLVPIIDRLKMPDLQTSDKPENWMEGGGYGNAVSSYSAFHSQLMAFVRQSLEVHKQQPVLSPNAVLRDYPNERLALDLLTELFFRESKRITDDYQESVDQIALRANDIKEDYLKRYEQYSTEYVSCIEGCGGDEYCLKECFRKYCLQECPSANKCNEQLQDEYKNFRMAFSQMSSDQTKLLDDFYGFAEPWFSKISSQYWSKIYAYEIQRTAFSIIANSFGSYPQAFPFPAHNGCGTDCSVFATPTPLPPCEVEKKDPKANDCPPNNNFKISISICDLGVDCESVEFGCTLIASGSIKRNFKKHNIAIFAGVGAKAELGVMAASAKAGAVVTVSDNGEVEDVGVKMDVSVSAGVGMARVGAATGGSYTVMKGGSSKLNFATGMGKPK